MRLGLLGQLVRRGALWRSSPPTPPRARRSQRLASSQLPRSPRTSVQESLLRSPLVRDCEVLGNTAYIVPQRHLSGSKILRQLVGCSDDDKSWVTDCLVKQCGQPKDTLPSICLVDNLPGDFDRHGAGRVDAHEAQLLREEARHFASDAQGQLEPALPAEEDRGLRAHWHAIEESQVFLRPTSVVDAGAQPLPPQVPGSLRFVSISDTHGNHRELTENLPPGDVLLHAGDFCSTGDLEQVRDFARWLRDLQVEGGDRRQP